jgi:hypothetical protein
MLDILCSDYIDGIGGFGEFLFSLRGSDDGRVEQGLQIQLGKVREVFPMDKSRGKQQEQTRCTKQRFEIVHFMPNVYFVTYCY